MGQIYNSKKLMDDIARLQSSHDLIELLSGIQQSMAIYESGIQEVLTKLEILQRDARFSKHNPIESIKSRVKSPMSILEKMHRKGFPISLESIKTNLNDIAGIRVICPFIEDIYTVADMLTRQDDLKVLEKKDYIQNPKPNGYRSYHLVLSVPVFFVRPQGAGAGRGPAAHHRHGFLGKPGTSNPLQSQPRSPGLCSWRTARVCGHHLPDRPKDAAPFQADPLYGGQKGLGQRADSFRRKISSQK